MRWISDMPAGAVRARLGGSLGRLAVRLELPTGGTRCPHPEVAASVRRCARAATNELFTDIETAPAAPDVRVPRLRLCASA